MLVIMIKGNSFLQLNYTMLMLKFKIKEKNQVFMNTSDFVFLNQLDSSFNKEWPSKYYI